MIIKEMIPQKNEEEFNFLLPAFLSIWNDPENLKYLSLSLQPLSKEVVKCWLSTHLDNNGRYIVGSDDRGEILGLAVIKTSNVEGFEIIGLGVQPKAKSQGIGSSLISHVISIAKDLDYKAVDISLFADNFIMMRILLRYEFMPVDIKHHARADGVGLLCMKRFL